MINRDAIVRVLVKANGGTQDGTLIAHQFTGFTAGIALALKDHELAEQINGSLTTEWRFGSDSPGGLYDPGLMAQDMIVALKQMGEGDGISRSSDAV